MHKTKIVTTFLTNSGKILLLKRSEKVKTMKNLWAGISGIIENDEKVHMVMTNEYSFSVDTQADLHNVERKMENDQLMKTYME